jgi:hypothetical protein
MPSEPRPPLYDLSNWPRTPEGEAVREWGKVRGLMSMSFVNPTAVRRGGSDIDDAIVSSALRVPCVVSAYAAMIHEQDPNASVLGHDQAIVVNYRAGGRLRSVMFARGD